MKPTLLILAAGMGNRYGGLKQLDSVGPNGEAIIDYSIFDAIQAGFQKVVFVIRESFADTFKETFNKKLNGKIEVEYLFQEIDNVPDGININPDRAKPWGTGHAVMIAKDLIHEPLVVINADDFYGPSAFQILADYLKQVDKHNANDYCMLGFRLECTLSEHGRVSRGICSKGKDDFLQSVVEHSKIEMIDKKIISWNEDNTQKQLTGREVVSMNAWGFTPSLFDFLESYFTDFIKDNANDLQAEFHIPFVVNELINKGVVKLKVLESPDSWFGVTYKEDKDSATEAINALIRLGTYPEKLW